LLVVGWHWIRRRGSSHRISHTNTCNLVSWAVPYGHTLGR
jgi:hypothetical protein